MICVHLHDMATCHWIHFISFYRSSHIILRVLACDPMHTWLYAHAHTHPIMYTWRLHATEFAHTSTVHTHTQMSLLPAWYSFLECQLVGWIGSTVLIDVVTGINCCESNVFLKAGFGSTETGIWKKERNCLCLLFPYVGRDDLHCNHTGVLGVAINIFVGSIPINPCSTGLFFRNLQWLCVCLGMCV